jgi:hypothetical protein
MRCSVMLHRQAQLTVQSIMWVQSVSGDVKECVEGHPSIELHVGKGCIQSLLCLVLVLYTQFGVKFHSQPSGTGSV